MVDPLSQLDDEDLSAYDDPISGNSIGRRNAFPVSPWDRSCRPTHAVT
jgi:hypothetical protein